MKNMKPKDNQQLLLIKYFRGIYLMMQFAQIKQSVYCVKPIWSNSLQYYSPVFLYSSGIRPIDFVNKSNTAIF